ncbi:MAG: acyltransferase family protein, partial [Rubrobacter sp.]
MPYRPGLDGLRAFAVIAVLLYHADLAWIPGGFLGVEVFFVISGYLITALLLAEWRLRGRIDLKTFWLRRARRLLPALYVLLVATLTFAVVFLPGEIAGLRGDVLAALGYVTNWYLIFGQESYFEAVGRPSLLQHLWSLAVEEQFYLIWPPILALGLCIGATRLRRRRVLTVVIFGAVASAMAMALLYVPGVDPSRIYYGTDTRATGLLCGAALAFLWSPGDKYRPSEARHHRLGLPGRSRFRRRWGWTAPLLLD